MAGEFGAPRPRALLAAACVASPSPRDRGSDGGPGGGAEAAYGTRASARTGRGHSHAPERKRREFDPALEAIHGLLAKPSASGAVLRRLRQMQELLTTMERVAERLLGDPASSRTMLGFVAGLPLGRKKR